MDIFNKIGLVGVIAVTVLGEGSGYGGLLALICSIILFLTPSTIK